MFPRFAYDYQKYFCIFQKLPPDFSSYDRIQTGQDLHWQLRDPPPDDGHFNEHQS